MRKIDCLTPSRCVALTWLSLALTACAADRETRFQTVDASAPDTVRCQAVIASVASEVQASATGDAEASQIPGHPYLRANRFLASFTANDMDAASSRAWLDRLSALALDGIGVEVGNLPPAARKHLDDYTNDIMQRSVLEAVTGCAALSVRDILRSPDARRKLSDMVDVPDHYDDLQRVVGVYPLTALPVAIGYDYWRQANLGTFAQEPRALPTAGRRVAYAPTGNTGALRPAEVRAILERSRNNPLGIPEPSPADTAQLFDAYAPVWLVDEMGPDDRIGAISWDREEALAVASDRPVVYQRLSWTRFGDDVLLQLNYLAWFPARPVQGPLDLLGGRLDGVIWRVTLGADGHPMIYDSIHACGCYHLFFPVPPMTAKPGPAINDIRERPEVPARGPELGPGDRVTIWLAGGSHYIQAISKTVETEPEAAQVRSYDMLPASILRKLERPGGGTRSMYRPDGIVDGTERLERFLLWPMGIASPGAMRQWGTHATAFVGRRHFDDPWLFDDAFQLPGEDRR